MDLPVRQGLAFALLELLLGEVVLLVFAMERRYPLLGFTPAESRA